MAVLFPVENPEEKKLKKVAQGIQERKGIPLPLPNTPPQPTEPSGGLGTTLRDLAGSGLQKVGQGIERVGQFVEEDIERGGPVGTLAQFAGASFVGADAAIERGTRAIQAIDPTRLDPEVRKFNADRGQQLSQNISTKEAAAAFEERPFGAQLLLGAALAPEVLAGRTVATGVKAVAESAPDIARSATNIAKTLAREEGGFARLGGAADELGKSPVTQTTAEIRKEVTRLRRNIKNTPETDFDAGEQLNTRLQDLQEELHVRAPRFKDAPEPVTAAQKAITDKAKNVTPELIAKAKKAGVPVTRPDTIQANILGLRPVVPGLTKEQELGNIAKDVFGKLGANPTKVNPIASGALRELKRVRPAIESLSNRAQVLTRQRVKSAFKLDKEGRVAELAGIDPNLVGAPTIQDIAARLPVYEAARKLTPEQVGVLDQIRKELEPFNRLMQQLDIDFGSRADVLAQDGGFYIPRGRAGIEGLDAPIVGRGSALKEAVFGSQTEGITAGFKYAPVEEAIGQFIRETGNRSSTKFIADFFKNAVDESGKLIGETPKVRLFRQNKDIAQSVTTIKQAIDRLTALGGRLTERQQTIVDRFINDPDFDDIDALRNALVSVKVRSGLNEKASIDEVKRALVLVKQRIKELKPDYTAALARAKNNPLGESGINLRGLEGIGFDDVIAASANNIIDAQGGLKGRGSGTLKVLNALNQMYRATRATGDNSALGIQGLLGLASDPKAYGKALKVNLQAWVDEDVLGRFIQGFDLKSGKEGRLSSQDWATRQLRIGGVETEFELGQGLTSKLSKLPGIRNANRAFGFFGDSLRLEWADDLLKQELRSGRNLDEITSSGDLEKIAEIANNMTGYSKNTPAGSIGELFTFAPRFLAARLETVGKAGIGLAKTGRGATVDQRAARNSILKMVAYGALITEGVNLMLGNETDRNPIKDGRFNSNFYTVRVAGRDRSIFGPWASLLGLMVNVGTGHPDQALRSLGSGVVSNAWDFLSGEDFSGKAVRDTPAQVSQRLLQNFIPFTGEELTAFGKQAIEGDPAGAVFNTAGEFLGTKSSPLTISEIEKERQIERFGDEAVDKGLGPRDIASVRQESDIKKRRDERATSRQRVNVDTQLQFSFERLTAVKEKRGQTIEAALIAGRKGKPLRTILQQAKTEMFNTGQALFTEEASEKLKPDEDTLEAFRAAYWSAPVAEDPETGVLDFAEQDIVREKVLIDAGELGFDPESIKERPIWFPNNPQAQEALDLYNSDIEELREFWTGTTDMVSEQLSGKELEVWQEFTTSRSQARKNRLRQEFPGIKAMEKERTSIREEILSLSPELDSTLIFWEFGTIPHTQEGADLLQQLQQ